MWHDWELRENLPLRPIARNPQELHQIFIPKRVQAQPRMVLIVDSKPIDLDLNQVIEIPQIKTAVTSFRSSSPGPESFSRVKSAFVMQGELARIDTRIDPDLLLSSGQATTCIIAAAICSESHTACICHMDQSTFGRSHIQKWLQGMQSPCIYLVGGYKVQCQHYI